MPVSRAHTSGWCIGGVGRRGHSLNPNVQLLFGCLAPEVGDQLRGGLGCAGALDQARLGLVVVDEDDSPTASQPARSQVHGDSGPEHLGLVDDPPLVASLHPFFHDGVARYTAEELVAGHRLVEQHAADPDDTILLRTVRKDHRRRACVLEVQRSRPYVGEVPRPEPEVLDDRLVQQGGALVDCLR